MLKNVIIAFAGGFICGVVSLGAAMAFRQAPDAAQAYTPIPREEREFFVRMNRVAENLNRFIETMEAQFVAPAGDAPEAALMSDLQTLRSQLELYKVQHHGRGPHQFHDGQQWNSDPSPENFVRRLTGRTNSMGHLMPEDGDPSDYTYGPYLKEMPGNPFAEDNADKVVLITRKNEPAPNGDPGWRFEVHDEVIRPNDPEHAKK